MSKKLINQNPYYNLELLNSMGSNFIFNKSPISRLKTLIKDPITKLSDKKTNKIKDLLELKEQIKELGDMPQSLIFVEVKQIYINDNVIELDEKQRIKVHADKVQPLARLGGGEYATINKPFSMARPK